MAAALETLRALCALGLIALTLAACAGRHLTLLAYVGRALAATRDLAAGLRGPDLGALWRQSARRRARRQRRRHNDPPPEQSDPRVGWRGGDQGPGDEPPSLED